MAEMASVCEGCPVFAQCALYALKADGGFYAGVWLPWKHSTGNSQLLRTRARKALRRRVSV